MAANVLLKYNGKLSKVPTFLTSERVGLRVADSMQSTQLVVDTCMALLKAQQVDVCSLAYCFVLLAFGLKNG